MPPSRSTAPPVPCGGGPNQADRRAAFAAAAVVLLAAALRVPTLDTWSVWIDEAFTLHDARHGAPPYFVSYALTRGAVALLGDDPWVLRLVPCLAGLATVALLLGARPAPGSHPRTPLVAAGVLAVLPWHVFMSQNARHYALQAFALLAAFLAADGRLSAANRPRPLVAGIALAVALGCHPTTMFFVPGLLLVALRHLHGRARAAVGVAGAVVGALAVGLYLPLRDGYVASKAGGSTWQLVASYGFLAGPALLLGALAGAAVRPRPAAEVALLLPTALVFLAASCVLFVSGYHAFASVPVVVLLAARGVLGAGRARLLLGAALAAGIAWGLWLYHAGHGLRPRFGEATAWLAGARDDGCRLFATQPPPVAYHLGDRDELRWPRRVAWLQPWTLDELEAALDAGPVAVLVHRDDLSTFAAPERARLDRLLARLPDQRPFACAYGPKDLTLVVLRSAR